MAISDIARNRVVSRTVKGVMTSYAYDGWNLIEDYDSSGNELARYIHGPQSDETRHEGNAALDSLKVNPHSDGGTWLPGRKRCQLLAKISPTGAVYYIQDGNQNVSTITDGTGAVVERYSYDVYGAATITDGAGNVLTVSGVGNRFMFTGRELISQIGIYDYRNRVYSPGVGRFLQTDPIRFQAGDINIYGYVGNSPVNGTDPDGLWQVTVTVGAGVGAQVRFGYNANSRQISTTILGGVGEGASLQISNSNPNVSNGLTGSAGANAVFGIPGVGDVNVGAERDSCGKGSVSAGGSAASISSKISVNQRGDGSITLGTRIAGGTSIFAGGGFTVAGSIR